jgi:hypothetical protein
MDTKVKPVEILPMVKYYMEELGLARLFDKFVPTSLPITFRFGTAMRIQREHEISGPL